MRSTATIVKILLSIFLSLFALHGLAQDEELEDIFDDGDKSSRFYIGTDIFVLGTGTANLNFEAKIVDGMYVRPGIGFMPLGAILDFGLWRPTDLGVPIIDRKISKGFYYDAQFRYELSVTQRSQDLDAYLYTKYKHWQYDYETDFEVKRFKISAGVGNSFGLKGRLHLDLYYGVVFSRDKFTYLLHDQLDEFEKVEERNYRFDSYKKPTLTNEFLFFELGIGLKYGL